MMRYVEGEIYAELEAALRARRDGNEGMARVCARHAAGWAIGLAHQRFPRRGQRPNAFQLLRWYASLENAPAPLRQAADRLMQRITKEHELPHPEDPLEDAETLVRVMLGEPQDK